jgi:hypothetical protein
MIDNPKRLNSRYLFSAAIFLGLTAAALIHVTTAIGSANIESRTMGISKSPYENGVSGLAAHENLFVDGGNWEDLAIFLCSLH